MKEEARLLSITANMYDKEDGKLLRLKDKAGVRKSDEVTVHGLARMVKNFNIDNQNDKADTVPE